jgi:hypothetical protein
MSLPALQKAGKIFDLVNPGDRARKSARRLKKNRRGWRPAAATYA